MTKYIILLNVSFILFITTLKTLIFFINEINKYLINILYLKIVSSKIKIFISKKELF